MVNMENQELQELLHELGYDAREYLDEDGLKFNRFMRQQDREAKREVQSYIDFIEDTDDDYFLALKSGVVERIRGERN